MTLRTPVTPNQMSAPNQVKSHQSLVSRKVRKAGIKPTRTFRRFFQLVLRKCHESASGDLADLRKPLVCAGMKPPSVITLPFASSFRVALSCVSKVSWRR